MCPGIGYSDDRQWAKRNENWGKSALLYLKLLQTFQLVLHVTMCLYWNLEDICTKDSKDSNYLENRN